MLHFTSSQRLSVAQQLKMKVPAAAIRTNIRDAYDGSFEKIHMITNKDIHNIEQSFGIRRSVERHSDDATSLKIHVDELKAVGDVNPVLHCKLQGTPQDNTIDKLQDCDFFSAMQIVASQIIPPMGQTVMILASRVC